MKQFIKDLGFVIIFITIPIVVGEILFSYRNCEFRYKSNYMQHHSDQISTLLLGNSLFANSFNPHILGDSVFNCAIASRTSYYDVCILQKYAPKMKNLKVVISPISAALPYSLHTDKYQVFSYKRYMNISSRMFFENSAFLSGQLTLQGAKVKPIFNEVPYGYNNEEQYIDSLGYSPIFKEWDGEHEYIQYPQYNEVIKAKDHYLADLQTMANICDSLDIRFIVVLPPVTNHYIKRTDYRIWNVIDNMMDTLLKKHKIEYKNYYNDSFFRTKDLFADELHLNYRGATLFSKRVKQDFNL